MGLRIAEKYEPNPFWVNADADTKKCREFAGWLGHGNNGGTIADADNAHGLPSNR